MPCAQQWHPFWGVAGLAWHSVLQCQYANVLEVLPVSDHWVGRRWSGLVCVLLSHVFCFDNISKQLWFSGFLTYMSCTHTHTCTHITHLFYFSFLSCITHPDIIIFNNTWYLVCWDGVPKYLCCVQGRCFPSMQASLLERNTVVQRTSWWKHTMTTQIYGKVSDFTLLMLSCENRLLSIKKKPKNRARYIVIQPSQNMFNDACVCLSSHRSRGFFWIENILHWEAAWVWCWTSTAWT